MLSIHSALYSWAPSQRAPARTSGGRRRLIAVSCTAAHVPGTELAYGGLCTCCSSSHFLRSTQLAVDKALELMSHLDATRRFDSTAAKPNPLLSTDYVFSKGPGRMLGVMLCYQPYPISQERAAGVIDGHTSTSDGVPGSLVALKAFSGQLSEYWHVDGWVGPVAGLNNTSQVYADYRRLTEELSARIAALQAAAHAANSGRGAFDAAARPGPKTRRAGGRLRCGAPDPDPRDAAAEFIRRQQQLLKRRRKALSHELLGRIQSSYVVHNMCGERQQLADIYSAYHRQNQQPHGSLAPPAPPPLSALSPQQQSQQQQRPSSAVAATAAASGVGAFPAGTGDCCAPKLLHAAAQRGLVPVSLVECWYGSPPNTATRQGRRAATASERQHKHFYGMCDKCEAILGSMLCGVERAQQRASTTVVAGCDDGGGGGNAGAAAAVLERQLLASCGGMIEWAC